MVAHRLCLHSPSRGEIALRAAVIEHDGVLIRFREVGRRVADDEDEPAPLQLGAEAGVGPRSGRCGERRAECYRRDGECQVSTRS
jgi:hypothetical protein